MSNRITVALALVAGFLGGALSHYVFTPPAVSAQAPVQAPAEIRAQKFVLVDEKGIARGGIRISAEWKPGAADSIWQYGHGHPLDATHPKEE